ncbi:MAG: hypothetical protein V1848_02035 [Candidatus Magasanikbacteria bacterium]
MRITEQVKDIFATITAERRMEEIMKRFVSRKPAINRAVKMAVLDVLRTLYPEFSHFTDVDLMKIKVSVCRANVVIHEVCYSRNGPCLKMAIYSPESITVEAMVRLLSLIAKSS